MNGAAAGMEQQLQALRYPAPLPERLLLVEQSFDAPRVENLERAARSALLAKPIIQTLAPGKTIAVGVGSRGIANIPIIVRAVVQALRDHQLQPFVFPAMGSHGGATAEGQRTLLAELGVTEASIGCEIRASMDVVEIGRAAPDVPLYQDRNASEADYTLLINRIKPHTDFRNVLESGLTKMAVIGMGKHVGASLIHAFGAAGFQRFLEPAARIYEQNTNLIGGLAVIENAYEETADLVALTASEIGTTIEQDLLRRARALMSSLPFPEIDILVLREIGKNISGTGLDTNIIGRLMIPGTPEPNTPPRIAVIAALDLTEPSHGNAAGIGLLNVTTTRLLRKIDWGATYTNAITSGIFGMQRTSLPITMADDRRALEVALRGCGMPASAARMVFAVNTLHLRQLWVSPSLRAVVEADPRLRIMDEVDLTFSADGQMRSPWALA